METSITETRQHSPVSSLALHLLPGIAILAGVFLFSQPTVVTWFGVAERLGPLFGYLLSLLVFLVPLQLAVLLLSSRKQYGKLALRAVIRYTQRSTTGTYLVLLPLLVVYNAVLFVVVAPRIQLFIVDALFSWYPEEYNFQLLMQSVMQDPAAYAGLRGVAVLVVAYLFLSGILGPFVEELYFRGFLLPRMERYAKKWAPFLNTLLFSVYHLFSPWENLIRIVALYPVIYAVWRRRDIRISIVTHVVLNTAGGVAFLFVLLR